MTNVTGIYGFRIIRFLLVGLFLLSLAVSNTVSAQDSTTKDGQYAERNSNTSAQSLAAQIQELQTKVKKLETTLKKKHAGGMKPGMQGRSMQGKMEQSMKKKDGMGMAAMPGQRMSGMGMMNDEKGMMSRDAMSGKGMSGMSMMGRMKGMGKMQMPSALPGFPGASHIYHIGAASFFLDHSEHITLTQEQQVKLNQIKEKVLLGQATFDRWISQAEQELWILTSSDSPDAAKIETKIREIEKLSSDQRIAYIRAVGEAVTFLTDEQRQVLVGHLPPDHSATNARDQN